MKYLWFVVLFLVGFYLPVAFGCAAIKPVVRTVEDIARNLCESVAQKHTDQLRSLTPADWCAIERNIEPFIDAVLSVQRVAGLSQVP